MDEQLKTLNDIYSNPEIGIVKFPKKCIQCLTLHEEKWGHEYNLVYKIWLQHELERVNKIIPE